MMKILSNTYRNPFCSTCLDLAFLWRPCTFRTDLKEEKELIMDTVFMVVDLLKTKAKLFLFEYGIRIIKWMKNVNVDKVLRFLVTQRK